MPELPISLMEDKPPMLRFMNVAVEDRAETIKQGRFVYMNAEKVYVRAHGDQKCEVPFLVKTYRTEMKTVDKVVDTEVDREVMGEDGEIKIIRDKVKQVVKEQVPDKIEVHPWKEQLQEKLRHKQISQNYFDFCMKSYQRWKESGELPIDGIPINGWIMISAAQQRIVLDANITTVEALADATEEAMAAIGMGANALKKKAQSYLTSQDTGQAAMEIDKLKADNEAKDAQLSALQQKMDELEAKVAQGEKRGPGRPRKEVA